MKRIVMVTWRRLAVEMSRIKTKLVLGGLGMELWVEWIAIGRAFNTD